jgi:hypothetical protein
MDLGQREAAHAASAEHEPKVRPIQAPAPPFHQERAEPESRVNPSVNERAGTARPEADKPDLSPSQRGVTQLIDYVRVLGSGLITNSTG